MRRNELGKRKDIVQRESKKLKAVGIKLDKHGWDNSNNYNNNKCGHEKHGERERERERVVIVLARRYGDDDNDDHEEDTHFLERTSCF